MLQKLFHKLLDLIFDTYHHPRQFIRYLIGGFSAFILDFTSYYFLVNFFKVPAGLTPTVAAPVVITYAFLVQKYFTFKSRGWSRTQMLRYSFLIVENWLISSLGLFLLVDTLGLDFRVGKVVIMVAVVANNFPMFKFWVFPTKSPNPALSEHSESKG